MSSFGPIPKLHREEVKMMIQHPIQPHSSYKLAPANSNLIQPNIPDTYIQPAQNDSKARTVQARIPHYPGVLLFVCGNPFPFPLSCQNQIN